jgi:hypothetical protein
MESQTSKRKNRDQVARTTINIPNWNEQRESNPFPDHRTPREEHDINEETKNSDFKENQGLESKLTQYFPDLHLQTIQSYDSEKGELS